MTNEERADIARALGPMAAQAWRDVEIYMEVECGIYPEFLVDAERSNLANLILNHMVDAVIAQRRSQKE